jgi:hypothetical protein
MTLLCVPFLLDAEARGCCTTISRLPENPGRLQEILTFQNRSHKKPKYAARISHPQSSESLAETLKRTIAKYIPESGQ